MIIILMVSLTVNASTKSDKFELMFDDSPLEDELDLPPWFSLSFLDLKESLEEAINANKKGLIIYFGRKDCPYCKSLLEGNWGDPAIAKYTQQNFNVIGIDVRGDRTVTDFNGRKWSEKTYASRRKMNFTPTLLFYNQKGQLALKLPGFRPKYQFRASLEYVADAHYERENFRSYMSRAQSALSFGSEELNEHDVFIQTYNLDRTKPAKQGETRKPLMVFFEHPKCHACDVLHGDTLNNPEVTTQLHELEVVQINTFDDTPITTPDGKKTTAKQWANELNLTFAPSLLFFDANGKELLRIESVIRFYRLNNVLRYIVGKEYQNFPTFQGWLHHIRNQRKAQE